MMGGGEGQVLEEAKLYYNQHYNAARQSSSKASGAAKSPLRSLTGGIHQRERGGVEEWGGLSLVLMWVACITCIT